MSRRLIRFLLLAVCFSGAAVRAQTPPAQPVGETLTDAERIARLKSAIEDDEAALKQLQSETDLNDPDNAFVQAERDFKDLDDQLETLKSEIQTLREATRTEEAEAKEATLSDLSTRRKLARERFDLAIEGRKTKLAQIENLQEKLRQQQAALDRLLGVSQPTTSQPTESAAPADATTKPKSESEQSTVTPSSQPEAQPATPVATPPAATTTPPAATPPQQPEKPKSEALKQAEEKAEEKERKASEAEVEAQSVADRIATVEKSITLAHEEVKQARQAADNAAATAAALEDEIERKRAARASDAEISELSKKLSEARKLDQKALADARSKANQLNDLQEELTGLQAEQIVALKEEEKTRNAAEEAKREVEWLQNPLSPRNALQWVVDHGPTILLIIVVMVLLLWVSRVAETRLITLLTVQSGRGTYDERKQRAETVVSAFRHTASMVVVAGGVVMILQEVGVAVTALLGGAAVAGLAVAFGAQNLIRDYFTGFMILLENQYGLNDVVTICGVSGLVERITLRTTVLRALDGTVHVIPNGQITTVSNMTHGWSRALFDIGVAYKEDADHVMNVLMEIGEALRLDPNFSGLILDDPKMLGVDAFGESEVVIRFYIKTRPLKQWEVKREMLRRIKKRFDEEGIEIPFPHRTVFHHHESGTPMFAPPVESGVHTSDDEN